MLMIIIIISARKKIISARGSWGDTCWNNDSLMIKCLHGDQSGKKKITGIDEVLWKILNLVFRMFNTLLN